MDSNHRHNHNHNSQPVTITPPDLQLVCFHVSLQSNSFLCIPLIYACLYFWLKSGIKPAQRAEAGHIIFRALAAGISHAGSTRAEASPYSIPSFHHSISKKSPLTTSQTKRQKAVYPARESTIEERNTLVAIKRHVPSTHLVPSPGTSFMAVFSHSQLLGSWK